MMTTNNIISVLQQTVNGVPAIVLDLLYLAAVDYIKAKEKAKQSKKQQNKGTGCLPLNSLEPHLNSNMK